MARGRPAPAGAVKGIRRRKVAYQTTATVWPQSTGASPGTIVPVDDTVSNPGVGGTTAVGTPVTVGTVGSGSSAPGGTTGPGPGPVTGSSSYNNLISNALAQLDIDPDTIPVPVPTLPSPLTATGALPAPKGLIGKAWSVLGYVPGSDLAAVSSAAAALQSALAEASGKTSRLTSKVSAARQALNSVLAQDASVQSQISTLRNSTIPGYQATIKSLTSQLASEDASLQNLETEIANWTSNQKNYLGLIAGIQSQITSLTGTFTSPSAAPASQLQSDAASSDGLSGSQDYKGGPNDPGSGPYDPSFSGFAPASFAFGSNYQGLASSSGAYYSAVGGGASSGTGGLRGVLASARGYVPSSSLASQVAAIGTMLGQLGTANGTIESLGSQRNGIQAQTVVAQGQLNSDTSVLSGLQGTAMTLFNDIQGLQGQTSGPGALSGLIEAATTALTGLQSDVQNLAAKYDSLQNYLQGLQAGGFPFSLQWSFGDGGTGTGQIPTHTYENPGTFQPSLTASVTAPNQVYTKTFTLGSRLIGQWPAGLNVTGGGGQTSGYLTWTVTDRQGNPVSGIRLLVVGKDPVGVVTGHQTLTTDSNGQATTGYNGAGTATATCLRNPGLRVQSGLATY